MKKKIVFIICNGRSGSTVLSKFLGTNSKCFALSEPHYFDKHFNDIELCSCEKSYFECDFWNNVISNMGMSKEEIKKFNTSSVPFSQAKENYLIKIVKYISLFLYVKLKAPYIYPEFFFQIKNEARLLESVMDLREETVFIDASKSIVRALFLMEYLGEKYSYYTIFLEREFQGVFDSMKKRKVNIKLKDGTFKKQLKTDIFNENQAIKQLNGMTRHNNIMKKIFSIRGKQILFEKFIKNPEKIFLTVCDDLEINWEGNMMNLDNSDHHLLGGNYSRISAKRIISQT